MADEASDEEKRKREHDRLNNAVKIRFAEGLNNHLLECPICIFRHPSRGCDVGRILWVCAKNGLEASKEDLGKR